jgi:2-polyprenyl-6-hydroxyphenyl methylase/3-demethylubiquinone-9 3-methyltransferase
MESTEKPGFESESYRYSDSKLNASHRYLLPRVASGLNGLKSRGARTVIDIGCGNGSVANSIAELGFEVMGVDASSDGIAQASRAYPRLRFERRSVYEELQGEFGAFDVVLSLEVIEHLYDPRAFLRVAHKLLQPGGHIILSTPFHGYWKNLAIASMGGFDAHFNSLADHGHIKFWSIETMTKLLGETGFDVNATYFAGRFRPLFKSMIFLGAPRRK